MTAPKFPTAFISYRHAEHESVPDADIRNRQHRAWVEQFVQDLRNCGVYAIYDGEMRELFRPFTALDPFQVPFLAEVSTIGCLVSHAFVPILTPSYIERLGYAGYQNQKHAPQSFVFEEWQLGCFYCNANVMQYIPIIRDGEPERMATLPLGVSLDNAFDMRDPAYYQQQVPFIAQRIYQHWDGDAPLITCSLGEWMAIYIDWCRKNYPGCEGKRVDSWQVDLLRPRMFVDSIFQSKKPQP